MTISLDATLAHLTRPATRRMPYRLPFRRGHAVVRGLTVREICSICDRHEPVRNGVWLLFGLSRVEGYERTDRDAHALLDIVQTSMGTRSLLALARITRLPIEAFAETVDAIVRLTVPVGAEDLFEPTRGERDKNEGQSGIWEDPSVVLTKLALRLDPTGAYLDWTPGRLLFLASTLGEHDAASARIAVVNGAYAARIGRADTNEGFQKAVSKIQRG